MGHIENGGYQAEIQRRRDALARTEYNLANPVALIRVRCKTCSERGRTVVMLTLAWAYPGWCSYSAKRSHHRNDLVNRVLPDRDGADLKQTTVELRCRQCSNRPRIASKRLRALADAARAARRDFVLC